MLLPSRFHQQYDSYLKKPIKRKIGMGLDVLAIKKDHTEFPIEVSLDYVSSTEGNYIIALIIDITRRKEFEHSLKQLNEELESRIEERTLAMSQTVKTLAKLIAEAETKDMNIKKANSFLKSIWNFAEAIIFFIDKEGLIKMFNPNAEKQLGYKAEEVIDKVNPILFFDEEELDYLRLEFSTELNIDIKEGLSILTAKTDLGLENEFETELTRKDGSKFPVVITLNKMGDYDSTSNENIEGYIAICNNITNRKKVEKELLKSLEKEKVLSDHKFKFLSLASHEFRTPLSVVLSSAFIISKYPKEEDHSKREKHIQRIISSVNILKDILNDFLSISKIEEGKMKVRNSSFDVNTHTNQIINELNGLLKNKQTITYNHQGETNMMFDAGMLKHIIINLLSNAIKFSTESSKITITSKKTARKFAFIVKDEGCGISKEDQKFLSDRFFRGSNATETQGTGLGLHIVDNYVKQMNGEMKFKSKLGVGTTVQLIFNELE
jgi:PAS domain S-box-containing protein